MSERAFMRVELVGPMAGGGAGGGAGVRAFESTDVDSLGGLMYRAYLDTVDYDGETPEQAVAEIRKTVQGEYGAFVPGCSKVAVGAAGGALSAALITRFRDRPFVAFTFTDPAFARQGLAQAVMRAAMSELWAQGERELRLMVTLANAPAIGLYSKLGFQFERR